MTLVTDTGRWVADPVTGWPQRPADRRPTFVVGATVSGETPAALDSDVGDVWLPRA